MQFGFKKKTQSAHDKQQGEQTDKGLNEVVPDHEASQTTLGEEQLAP
jgi:hypothetical protein